MVDVIIKKFDIPAMAAGERYLIRHNGVVLSESSLTEKFVPFLGISVLNRSNEPIDVFLNNNDDSSFPVSGNAARSLNGVPAWDIGIINRGVNPITAGQISVTLINDLEQVSRYNAYAKVK